MVEQEFAEEYRQLEQAIIALEAQRTTLGDAVVEASIAALREKQAALAAPPAADQQRKQITVLFADVSGFTAMSETLDAEDVTDIMNALWARLDQAIIGHGGLIDKHLGDGVMALWGAETAREDDAEQAIRAALVMQTELVAFREGQPVGLAMRVGINTGPVLLSEVGTTSEYTAIGDTVNTASRLEYAAPVGGILISHATYRHVRGVFDVHRLDPIQVKGKAELLQVYVVQRAKPRAFRRGTRGVEGVETRMIGRQAELKQLQAALSTVMAAKECRLVTISGEAGVGKSRLLYEFEDWVDLLPEEVRYFRGRADWGMQNLPYALLRDLLAFRFQIRDSDRARVVREKMERGIGQALGPDGAGQVKAHFVGQLLGFDFAGSPYLQGVLDDARQIHDRALIYLSDYFKAVTAQGPVLILLEDVHWADGSSLDAIDYLASTMAEQSLLVVCTARPTLFERRPRWAERQTFHTRLELRPLSRRDSHHLVEEVLQKVDQVPEALYNLVVGGAEGNPFYVEELVKMLIEDGIIVKDQDGQGSWHIELTRLTSVRVPPTLTSVLQARLDSLPLAERTVLQQASVVGRTFWDNAVERINESVREEKMGTGEGLAGPQAIGLQSGEGIVKTLSALQDKEMIFRRETLAFAGTQEYIFKHAILREVTYESVLKRERRVYHALVAGWLIEQGGERAGEYTGLIADHLELAGQTERAAVYLRRAGRQAAGRFANAEAVNYFSRALDLIPGTDAARAERYVLFFLRERVCDVQGQRKAQRQDLAALEELANALDDDRRRAEVALRQANYADVTDDYPEVIVVAQAVVRLGRASGDVCSQAGGHLFWGRALWRQGDHEAARPQLERALALARTAGARQVEADSLRNLSAVCYHQHDYAACKFYMEQARRIYCEIGDRRGEGTVLSNLGKLSLDRGDYAAARTYPEQALRLFREIGDRRGEDSTLNNLGEVARFQGDYGAALGYYEQGLRICREIGDRQGEAYTLLNLSLVAPHVGDCEAARTWGERALYLTREIGSHTAEAYALTNLGHALAGLGRLAEAAASYQRALDMRRELQQQTLAVESLAGLASVSLARGDPARAQAQVEGVLHYLESGTLDGTEEPFRIYLTCYRVLHANQDPRAREVLATAYHLLQEQAARIGDEEMRRSFLERVVAHREIWQMGK